MPWGSLCLKIVPFSLTTYSSPASECKPVDFAQPMSRVPGSGSVYRTNQKLNEQILGIVQCGGLY